MHSRDVPVIAPVIARAALSWVFTSQSWNDSPSGLSFQHNLGVAWKRLYK